MVPHSVVVWNRQWPVDFVAKNTGSSPGSDSSRRRACGDLRHHAKWPKRTASLPAFGRDLRRQRDRNPNCQRLIESDDSLDTTGRFSILIGRIPFLSPGRSFSTTWYRRASLRMNGMIALRKRNLTLFRRRNGQQEAAVAKNGVPAGRTGVLSGYWRGAVRLPRATVVVHRWWRHSASPNRRRMSWSLLPRNTS